MPAFQWARLKENVETPLRRGAWYRILKLTSSEAALDVGAGAQECAALPRNVGPPLRGVSELPGPRATGRPGAEHAVPPLQRIVRDRLERALPRQRVGPVESRPAIARGRSL